MRRLCAWCIVAACALLLVPAWADGDDGGTVAAAPALPSIPLRIERADGTFVRYLVEVARSDAARRQGLMYRRVLAADTGMLFDFGTEQAIAMWMRNTYVALDMVFADAQGRVVAVIADTVPLSETLLMPRQPARFVLELAAGQAQAQAIAPGARLALPAALRTTVSAP